LVDKALHAEKEGLWGRAYFDLRKITDPAYKLGDDMIRNASEICRRLGFETLVDEGADTFSSGFPMSHIAFYAGWYSEHVTGPFALPKVEFMPGAFAYHLHSYSANSLRTTNHHWVGPLLAKGVTITMGTIDEPYLSGTPDMSVFTARFLVDGFTFGEAAYACQTVLSWQTTVVGDPLYQPFRKNIDQLAREMKQQNSKLAEWYYLRLINLNQANGRQVGDLVSLVEQIPDTTNSAVLQEKLGDLYAAQGKPSSSVYAGRLALKLDPSLQQRVRLRLALGERMIGLEQNSDAFENYQLLLRECPEYPDKQAVYRKLLTLAQKLDKKSDAERYESELKR
jgi:tetratricopeptide (TPR) repeat protein